jgi:hypothetical protein
MFTVKLKFLYNQIPFQTAFEAILLDQRSLQCQKSPNVNSYNVPPLLARPAGLPMPP